MAVGVGIQPNTGSVQGVAPHDGIIGHEQRRIQVDEIKATAPGDEMGGKTAA